MSLIENMTALNARLTSIPIRFGVPQHRRVMVRHVDLAATATKARVTDTLLAPLPVVMNVPPRLVGVEFQNTVTVREDDYMLKNIPRTYTKDFLVEGVEFYAIDVTVNNGVISYDNCNIPVNAELCKLVHIDDGKLLTWELILRKIKDGRDSDGGALF